MQLSSANMKRIEELEGLQEENFEKGLVKAAEVFGSLALAIKEGAANEREAIGQSAETLGMMFVEDCKKLLKEQREDFLAWLKELYKEDTFSAGLMIRDKIKELENGM